MHRSRWRAGCRRILGAGRLVALLKPDGKLRPIGIPTFLRRLAARAVLAQFRADISAHFAPHQLGIGVPFGVEAIPRAAQAWLDSHPGHGAALIDISNAFNTVSRAAIFAALHGHPVFRRLLPLVASLYAEEGDLWTRAAPPPPPPLVSGAPVDGQPPSMAAAQPAGTEPPALYDSIASSEGTQQGDPLAGFLFALAIHPCLLRAAAAIGHRPALAPAGAPTAAAAAATASAAAAVTADPAAAPPPTTSPAPPSTGLCLAIADDITLIGYPRPPSQRARPRLRFPGPHPLW